MGQISKHILQRVADFIVSSELLTPNLESGIRNPEPDTQNSPLLYVALSGGPDSVALLHILRSLGYRCEALHCNFHLRGSESDRDQHFCEELCRQLDIPLQVREFDTLAYMTSHHLSLEMAARQLRYGWWQEVIEDAQCSMHIALGHHADDSIETALMNLMRGTGIQGLTGIVPRNDETHVIRPLLCLSRRDILDYLKDNGLSYVTDSTNAECDTLRNQVRNELLPLMERLLPQSRRGILTTMQHLHDSASFIDLYIKEWEWLTTAREAWGLTWHELSLDDLRREFRGPIDSFVHAWEQQYCDRSWQRTERSSDLLYTRPKDDTLFEQSSPTLDCVEYELMEPPLNDTLFAERFDAATVTLPLTLRRWQEGDRMAPLGMQGHSKLVSDLMHDAHFTPMQKLTTWLVADATGSILWVIGLRMSELHKVTPHTSTLLRLSAH